MPHTLATTCIKGRRNCERVRLFERDEVEEVPTKQSKSTRDPLRLNKMMIKLLLLVCSVLVLFTPDAEGGCGCHEECSLHCRGLKCHTVCRLHCSCSLGKRDEPEGQLANDDSPVKRRVQVFPIPLPYKFSDYDENKDGRISFTEFKNTLPPVKETKGIRKSFDALDIKPRDSYIDCAEFLKGKIDTDGKKLVCNK